MNVFKQATQSWAAVGICLTAMALSSCNSLEVSETDSAAQAEAKKKESVKPRLSSELLASHGLEEIWYLGKIAADGGDAGIDEVYLLPDGLFAVTQPVRERSKRHLIRFHRSRGESIWYEDLPGRLEFRPYAYHYPPSAQKDPELFYSYMDEVTCLDLDTGRELWSRELSIPISTPIVADEHSIFAGSDLKKCFATPRKASVELWTYVTGGKVESEPLLAGDKIVFASHDGHIVGLAPIKGFDTLRSWDVATGARVRGNMSTYGGWIFAGSEDYKLYCLGLDGSIQWSYVAEAPINDTPVVYRVAPNREFVYVISDKDSLHRTPRTLLAMPLPRGEDVGGAQPIWRVENVRKVVSLGRRSLYVLMEPSVSGERVLAALDFNTGKERFRIDLAGWNFVPTNLADNGRDLKERGRLYLVSQSGAVQVIGEKLE